ncbi:hypothetical protein [Photobacterium swingsii]|uniref:hypothetical protein n=1 Tax=Photobacterium swingsii TaxID=680026 RepID=UPI004067F7D3
MKNNKRNHHFVSQVEQRLNALNPNAIKAKNKKIYAFKIIDRNNYNVQLINPKGVKIENNLSDIDVFSFDILTNNERLNFEDTFSKYESKIEYYTNCLLNKIRSNEKVGDELFEIFVYKLLNTFRNPYCIKKTLATFDSCINYYPTDESLARLYKRIDCGHQPHFRNVSCRYGVSEDEYKKWLKILFLITLVTDNDGLSMLEAFARSIYINEKLIANVFLFHYTSDVSTLLSDRSFTITTDEEEHTTFEFNLTSNAFISFCFTSIDKFSKNVFNGNEGSRLRMLDFIEKRPPEVNLLIKENDMDVLNSYNKRVIFQSKEHVYSASFKVYGL